MQIGLDIHGVVDKFPVFSELSKLLVNNGHEVHIITGEKDSKDLRDKLEELGIHYTHVFSITSYHDNIGTPMTFDENNNPWMNDQIWNQTKAQYCKDNQIDLHIDDSEIYGKYFKTPYLRIEKINEL